LDFKQRPRRTSGAGWLSFAGLLGPVADIDRAELLRRTAAYKSRLENAAPAYDRDISETKAA
jgi:hypothetical protein